MVDSAANGPYREDQGGAGDDDLVLSLIHI